MLTQRTLYLVATLSLGWISLSLGQDASVPPAAKEQQLPRARQGALAPPAFPLKDTLDTDRDGKLSGDEIKAAPSSLKKLDKNNDGKLSAEEIGWPPRRLGFPGGPGFPMGGPPGGLGERGGRSLAQRILDRDADGDGKVIHSRPEAAWTVTSLAEQVNMSKSAFSERFREVVGKPPLHYLTEYRLRKASQLLSETRLGVKEISSQVGYDSVSSFSTAFKRWIGNSPSAFRRNGRTAV